MTAMTAKVIRQTVCIGAIAATLCSSWQPVVDACTRSLWNTNKLAVVVGRTMDWAESTQPIELRRSQIVCEQGGVGALPPARGSTPAPRSHLS